MIDKDGNYYPEGVRSLTARYAASYTYAPRGREVIYQADLVIEAECRALLAIEQMHAETRNVLDAAVRSNRRGA